MFIVNKQLLACLPNAGFHIMYRNIYRVWLPGRINLCSGVCEDNCFIFIFLNKVSVRLFECVREGENETFR